jgi:hypothetical protein
MGGRTESVISYRATETSSQETSAIRKIRCVVETLENKSNVDITLCGHRNRLSAASPLKGTVSVSIP